MIYFKKVLFLRGCDSMRNLFPGYYRPTNEDFRHLWKTCIFTFDANVLLNLYRYTPETREDFFKTLEALSERVWITNQAALEYQRNRLQVIKSQRDDYNSLAEQLRKLIRLELSPHNFKEQSLIQDFIKSNELEERLRQLSNSMKKEFQDILKKLEEMIAVYDNWMNDKDEVRERLDNLFDSRVGNPYPAEELEGIYLEGELRYKREQPPGFADKDSKAGVNKYGDLVLWKQLIDRARETKLPMVFVTDEKKDDWWSKLGGSIFGPHPSLIQEIHAAAQVPFYMYSATNFLKRSQDYLALTASFNSVAEVEVVEEASTIPESTTYTPDLLSNFAIWYANRTFDDTLAIAGLSHDCDVIRRAVGEFDTLNANLAKIAGMQLGVGSMLDHDVIRRAAGEFDILSANLAKIAGMQLGVGSMLDHDVIRRAAGEFDILSANLAKIAGMQLGVGSTLDHDAIRRATGELDTLGANIANIANLQLRLADVDYETTRMRIAVGKAALNALSLQEQQRQRFLTNTVLFSETQYSDDSLQDDATSESTSDDTGNTSKSWT